MAAIVGGETMVRSRGAVDLLRKDTVAAVEGAKFKGVICRECGQ